MVMRMSDDYVRTTILLRRDLHQKIKRSGRSLSDVINERLAADEGPLEAVLALFGSTKDRPLTTDDLRDHEDHHP